MESVSWLNPLKAQVFATTRWSVVRACNDATDRRAREALGEICQAYWQPVYACIRHRGHSPQDAEDLTQDFFAQLLAGRYFEQLDQSRGRFRAFLSVALRNFLRDRWRRRWTWRRAAVIVSLESQQAESGYSLLPATQITPESLYERQWAHMVIENALEQLRIELSADGKGVLLEHFDAILMGDTAKFPYAKVAQNLNLTVGALHASLHRWRRRFQILMREEIARTVLSKSEVENELRHLLSTVART